MANVPTVPNSDRILDSTPGSLTTDFSIVWPVVGATATECANDLGVWVDGLGVLDPITDYSFIGTAVSGVNGIYNGGTLRLVTGVTGVRVVIWSQRAPRRTGSFLEGAPLPFSTLDALMDDFAIQLRDANLAQKSALHYPLNETAAGADSELPDLDARTNGGNGAILVTDPATGDIEVSSVSRSAMETVVANGTGAVQIAGTNLWSRPVFGTLTTPPSSPTTGDRYLIGAGASGAWASYVGQVAEWGGVAWVFSGAPLPGQDIEEQGVGRIQYLASWGAKDRADLRDFALPGTLDLTGTNDETSVWNKAVTALNGASEPLYLPAGKITLGTASITPIGTNAGDDGFMNIIGAAAWNGVGSAGGTILQNASATNDLLTVYGQQNTIERIGLTMAPGVVATAGIALKAVSVGGLKLRDFFIDGGVYNGLYLDGVHAFTIEQASILNTIGDYGFKLDGVTSESTGKTRIGTIRRLSVIPGQATSTASTTTDGIVISDNVASIEWEHVVVNYANRGAIIGSGSTSLTPTFLRFRFLGLENCNSDGLVLNNLQDVWLYDLYSCLHGGNGTRFDANMSVNGGPVWMYGPRCSGNGKHGISIAGSAGIEITAPRCGQNSVSNRGPATINTYDGINVSGATSYVRIVGGRSGGTILEGEGTISSSQRYGLSIESTVTAGRVQAEGIDLNGNLTGPVNDAGGVSVGRLISDCPGFTPATTARRNGVVNGGFQVWQRGTSFAFGDVIPTADFWIADRGSTGHTGATLSRQSGENGAYCARMQRNSADTQTNSLAIAQVFETKDSLLYASQWVKVVFRARAGADFSALNSKLDIHLVTGTGTDDTATNMFAGSWAGNTDQLLSQTITTGWTTYSAHFLVPSSATQMAVKLLFTPVGTASTNDYCDIEKVRLLGAYDWPEDVDETFDMVLDLCERRVRKTFDTDTTPAQNVGSNTGAMYLRTGTGVTGTVGNGIRFDRPMRATPTVTTYNPAATNANARDITNSADRTVSVANKSARGFDVDLASAVAGAQHYLHWLADAEFA